MSTPTYACTLLLEEIERWNSNGPLVAERCTADSDHVDVYGVECGVPKVPLRKATSHNSTPQRRQAFGLAAFAFWFLFLWVFIGSGPNKQNC